jgi:hypothetical protein
LFQSVIGVRSGKLVNKARYEKGDKEPVRATAIGLFMPALVDMVVPGHKLKNPFVDLYVVPDKSTY